jgi:citrate synthase
VLSEVDGEAGRLILRGHRLQDIAGRRSVEWLIAELWRGFAQGNLSEPSLRRDLAAMRAAVFGRVYQVLE